MAQWKCAASQARAWARTAAGPHSSGLGELRAEGKPRTTFLLRFTLSHPEMDTTIVGTLHPEHLAENVQGAEQGSLPADVYAEAKRRLDALQ